MSIGVVLLSTLKNDAYFLLGKILNILVPHFSQVPVIALPSVPPFLLKGTSLASFIILPALSLHLTQYALTCSMFFV